ncbi:MAG: hypothetical protein ACON4J_00090, partial [Parvibaculales bacterium]
NNVMALGFGWAYAGVYVGIWEMVWRIRHYRKIREMGRAFQGRWFSTLTMGFVLLPVVVFGLIWLFIVPK